jgi:ABC-2 type transport system ATP-binding protein
MKTAIETQDLTKTFRGSVVAVTGLDMGVPSGAFYGLIGRNGAGKTTALRLLMGLSRPDSGWGRILGWDLWEAPARTRQKVAYVAQNLQLPAWMTLENLSFTHAHFYDRWNGDWARRLARQWELPWGRPVGQLSGGQQRQAAIVLALAARPAVLILDEPAAGLDPLARRELLSSLVDALCQGEGCTVLFSTHLISDLERIADHVGVMDRGRLVVAGRLEALLQTTRRVQVVFDQSEVPAGFTIPGARRSRVEGPVATAVVHVTHEDQLQSLRQQPGLRVSVFPMSLEEIFLNWFDREGGIPADEPLVNLDVKTNMDESL